MMTIKALCIALSTRKNQIDKLKYAFVRKQKHVFTRVFCMMHVVVALLFWKAPQEVVLRFKDAVPPATGGNDGCSSFFLNI